MPGSSSGARWETRISSATAGAPAKHANCTELSPVYSNAAPFIAFTNGSAYLLGHVVTSNEIYAAAASATGLSVNVLMPGQSGFSEILRPLGSHYPDASERTKTRMIQCVR